MNDSAIVAMLPIVICMAAFILILRDRMKMNAIRREVEYLNREIIRLNERLMDVSNRLSALNESFLSHDCEMAKARGEILEATRTTVVREVNAKRFRVAADLRASLDELESKVSELEAAVGKPMRKNMAV